MGATYAGKTSPRTRHGLIALIAIRQAQAVRQGRERKPAERETNMAAKAETKPKKRGWFG